MSLLPPYRDYGSDGTICNVPGLQLALVAGFSGATVRRWLQLFDGAPELGDVPRQSIAVEAGGSFSFAPSSKCPPFAVGCYWAVSSTGPTYTPADVADSFWVYAEGEIV